MNNEQLYYNGAEISAPQVPIVNVSGTSQQLQPNTLYRFGSVASVTITLATPPADKTAIYWFSFTASSNSTTVTLPSTVKLANDYVWDIVANRKFEVMIQDNVATVIYAD